MLATIGTIILTVVLSVVVYIFFALMTNSNKGCCGRLSENNSRVTKNSCCGARENSHEQADCLRPSETNQRR
jgi:hypothetical protein